MRAVGGQVEAVVADVRDLEALQAGIDRGIARFGDVDIVVANAGVVGIGLPDPADGARYITGTALPVDAGNAAM